MGANIRWLHGTVPTADGAAWLDKDKSRCLVLWKTIAEWADVIQRWVSSYGQQDSVFAIEELSSGDDVQGTGPNPALVLNAFVTGPWHSM